MKNEAPVQASGKSESGLCGHRVLEQSLARLPSKAILKTFKGTPEVWGKGKPAGSGSGGDTARSQGPSMTALGPEVRLASGRQGGQRY